MRRAGSLSLILALFSITSLHAGTTLSKAAISGDLAKVKASLAGGEKINEIDKWGMTPLIWAVYYRYLPIVQYLLEQKADPNIQSTDSYRSIPEKATALNVAAYYGLEAHVLLLLKYGADTELLDENNKKAIDYAKEYNFIPIVNALSKGKSAREVSPAPPEKHNPVLPEKPTPELKAPPPPVASRTVVVKEHPMTNQDVLNMLLSGQGDVVVINKIKKAPKEALDTSAKALEDMRERGVSKAVIQAMIQRAGK